MTHPRRFVDMMGRECGYPYLEERDLEENDEVAKFGKDLRQGMEEGHPLVEPPPPEPIDPNRSSTLPPIVSTSLTTSPTHSNWKSISGLLSSWSSRSSESSVAPKRPMSEERRFSISWIGHGSPTTYPIIHVFVESPSATTKERWFGRRRGRMRCGNQSVRVRRRPSSSTCAFVF